MSLKKNAVAVISSGNGGQSLAAYYALHGLRCGCMCGRPSGWPCSPAGTSPSPASRRESAVST